MSASADRPLARVTGADHQGRTIAQTRGRQSIPQRCDVICRLAPGGENRLSAATDRCWRQRQRRRQARKAGPSTVVRWDPRQGAGSLPRPDEPTQTCGARGALSDLPARNLGRRLAVENEPGSPPDDEELRLLAIKLTLDFRDLILPPDESQLQHRASPRTSFCDEPSSFFRMSRQSGPNACCATRIPASGEFDCETMCRTRGQKTCPAARSAGGQYPVSPPGTVSSPRSETYEASPDRKLS